MDARRLSADGDVEATAPAPATDADVRAAAAAASAGDSPVPKSNLRIVFPSLMLAMFLAALDQTIVSTALPTIASELNASPSQYSWVGTSYLLLTTTLTPCYGRLSDLLGRKAILYFSIAMFTVASAFCGAAQNIEWLIAARAFQGVGGGGIMSMVTVCIGDVVPFGERGKYQGYVGGIWGVASVLGPILGGLLTDRASWRWCFFINLPTCVVAFVLLWFTLRLPDHPRVPWAQFKRDFDWAGLALLVISLGCLVVGFEHATDSGFKDHVTIALVTVGAVFICGAGVYFCKTPKRGIIPARILRTRTTGALMLVSYLQAFCFLSSTFFLPNWWQSVKGVNATMSGVYMLSFSLMVSAASMPTGWYISKYGNVGWVIRIGYSVGALGFGLMNLMNAKSSLAINEIFPMIAALGIGMSLQPPLIMLQAAMPLREMAASTSSWMLCRALGSTTSISIVGSILASRQDHLLRNIPGYDFVDVPSTRSDYEAIHRVEPPEVRHLVLGALAESFTTIFKIYTVFMGVCLILTAILKRYSLQEQYVAKEDREPTLPALPVPEVPLAAKDFKAQEEDITPATPRSDATLAVGSDSDEKKTFA